MAEAVLYGVAQEILRNVGSTALTEMASAWGFKPDLEKLKITINTVRDYLLDAEEKQADSHAVRGWLTRLTDVVYAADDLFDEFATVASRKQLMGESKFTQEVRTFLSRNNQIAFSHSISRKIRTVREELDAIVKEGSDFDLVRRSYDQGKVITKRRDQSYSFVEAEEVIGRDTDKKAILELLLSSSSNDDDEHEQRVMPVISIVGIGGMGKTTLAQLIYNDPLVKEFFEVRLWVCVSDVFDTKEIIENSLKSATNSETPKLEIDQLQVQLRKEIGDKKYLLVLDDVWNENREKWLKLRDLLKIGRIGSKILLTTRSSKVAKIMGTVPPYELRGLSEVNSWDLFRKVAFAPGQAQQMPQLLHIGKEIVQQCANVPLAIRTLGSILYGENESKWLSIKDKSLANIFDNEWGIMNILKVSYHHLDSTLKNCFAYCALFPKDYNFNKEMLINLWMAEGFIVRDAAESKSYEELGEDYFLTLLQRGFFQDVKADEWGFIEGCKMHDCMHDLAQQVNKVKCKVVNLNESHYQDNIRHLSIAYQLNFQNTIPPAMLSLKLPRTLQLPQQVSDGSTFNEETCKKIISSFSCLRVLDLHALGLSNLPASIGNLIHLRYLDISLNPIRALPDSITKLHNLQALNVSRTNLLALPTKTTHLVNLRRLDVSDCDDCVMPSGVGELNFLHNLPLFISTCEKNPTSGEKPTHYANLSDLKKLNNLRGKLCIVIRHFYKTKLEIRLSKYGELKSMMEATDETLTCKHGLIELEIHFRFHFSSKHDEKMLECLKPHPNLRKLKVVKYHGQNLPSWAMKESLLNTLPNLVKIDLYKWYSCREVPDFSQLPLLKCLSLVKLRKVEYIEMEKGVIDPSSSIRSELFFPSLETLELSQMSSLKAWRKGVYASSKSGMLQSPNLLSLSFPKLSNLTIYSCRFLRFLPSCPNVEKLHLLHTDENLSILKMATRSSLKFKELRIANVDELLSIPKQCLNHLSSLKMQNMKLIDTEKLGDVFATLSSTLRSLQILDCRMLKSIHKGLEHLTSLEEFVLNISHIRFQDEDQEMPWKAFKTSLRTLRLGCHLYKLPRGFQHLTNLRTLELSRNHALSELPEWISCFSSLQSLELYDCSILKSLPEGFRKLTSLQELRIIACSQELTERCRGPNGSDWTKIQHIPLVVVKEYSG